MSDSAIQVAKIVSVALTKVWIESDFFGGRIVVMQHEGYEPFDYATFHYDYKYTSNAGTLDAATKLALSLGATAPVENKARYFRWFK